MAEAVMDPLSGAAVVILLSTYNGAEFVTEQIESIQRQTVSDWMLLVRDDGSSDETAPIVRQLADRDRRILLTEDSRGNLGPAASYGLLLEWAAEAGARYVALSDQDDVWRPDKLARELELLRSREAEVGADTPILVHSDLTVVAEDLSVLHPSFLRFQGLEREAGAPLGRLLVQNFVTGCTVVLNRALVDVATPLPKVVMHDWWLALCAAALGQLAYLPEPTVLYRQHGRNATGGRWRGEARMQALRHPASWWHSSADRFSATLEQARELARLLERRGGEKPVRSGSIAMVRDYCNGFTKGIGALRRLRMIRRHGIRPHSLLGYPVFFYVRVLSWSGESRDGLPRVTLRSP
jgi:hypothetical protein